MKAVTNAHARIEKGFEHWGELITRQPWLAVLAALVPTVLLGLQIPNMRVDNSDQSYLHSDDPARQTYDAFRDQFGQDETIVVALAIPSLFELDFLEQLRALHQDMESELPYVSEVTSLWNARYSHGKADQLIVEDLLEEWPESEEDLIDLRRKVSENPLYLNQLVSEDLDLTVIALKPFIYSTLGDEGGELEGFDDGPDESGLEAELAEEERPEFLTDAEQKVLVEALQEVLERYEGRGFDIHLAGGPVFNVHFNNILAKDLVFYVAGCAAAIAFLLLGLLRRISGVLMPMVVVFCSLIATLGVQVLLDVPMSIVLQIVPVLLLTVGVCDAVHILVIVYQQMREGREKQQAIVYAMGHSGLAVLMTSVTTAGGLMSFTLADMAPVANLGKVAPMAVMLTFLYTIILLPALLTIFPLARGSAARADANRGESTTGWLPHLLAQLGVLCARRPGIVLSLTGVLIAIAAVGVSQLRFAQHGITWFPKHDPMRLDHEFLDDSLGGMGDLSVWIDSRGENGLHDPDTLNRIETLIDEALALEGAPLDMTTSTSMLDVLKETHKSLNANQSEFFAIPQEKQVVAQELLLFENSGSDDLEDFVDSQFQSAAVGIRMPMGDGFDYQQLLEILEPMFSETLGDDVDFKLTGGGPLFTAIFTTLSQSLASSYSMALLIITPLMILLIGNIRGGLVSMIPNLIPIFFTLGLMGWLGIPLDTSSMLIGGVIIGIAVDDTIHFMHKFQRYLALTGDTQKAVYRTLTTTGSALLYTTLVLTAGFAVIGMSYMVNMQWFGLLAGFSTVGAFLADVIVGPALMSLLYGRK